MDIDGLQNRCSAIELRRREVLFSPENTVFHRHLQGFVALSYHLPLRPSKFAKVRGCSSIMAKPVAKMFTLLSFTCQNLR